MHQDRFAKPVARLGTLAAAAILALALVGPSVNAQGKSEGRGAGPPAASGGDKGGSSMSSGDKSGSSKSGGDRSSNTRSYSEQRGRDDGRRHRDDGRHHSRRGSDVTIGVYGYGDGGCGWLHRRAVNSGSSYWWRRYRACVRGY
jgi:hypothetical protein